ncbi:MAG TPA: hypothetical protein PKO09_00015 [Anaerolineae bacterium]|nr:hypothetical protein [Anaerolineae bacterium]
MSKRVAFGAVLFLLVASLLPAAALAQSATGQTWSTSITYYTPDPNGGTLLIHYYPEGSGTPIDADPITLAGHAAGSLFIGSVPGMPGTFGGSAVLEANVPIVATAVNIAGEASSYPRPLYGGFDGSQASQSFFIPSVLYQAFGQTSLLAIQNVESGSIDATLKVYASGAVDPSFQATYTIPGQSSQLVPAADMGLAAGFSGSAVVTATGKVVAAAQETDDSSRGAKAFEGVAAEAGATEIYMASMMCRAYAAKQISYYAIQNVGDSSANVEIDFYNTSGTLLYTATGLSIAKNNKLSKSPCDFVGSAPSLEGAVGSAVIRSTNSIPLIAIGKISTQAKDMTPTAFVGQSGGAIKIAAPYIRWKTDPALGERSFVAVMNVGGGDATDVVATYYDSTGTARATHTLATAANPLGSYIKANTDWASAGGTGDFGVNPYGGAIEITSDQPLVVVVRVSKTVSFGAINKFAEDYNGVAVP